MKMAIMMGVGRARQNGTTTPDTNLFVYAHDLDDGFWLG